MLYYISDLRICLCCMEFHYFYWSQQAWMHPAALDHHCYFSHLQYSYINVQHYLKYHTLTVWRCHLDMLFFFLLYVYDGSKFCPTLWENFSPHVQNRNLEDFILFNAFKHCNCPCTICTSEANAPIGKLVYQWKVCFD